MSVDSSRPLVPSMGQHDAVDGLVTCAQLQATAAELGGAVDPDLTDVVADFAAMTRGQDLVTADPLGLGGLLADASRVAELMARGVFADGELLDTLLASALAGLPHYVRQGDLEQPAARRLAFRELGLAIGLRATALLRDRSGGGEGAVRPRTTALLDELAPYLPLATRMTSFWLDPAHRQSRTWVEHQDINDVMLATALVHPAEVSLV